MDKDLQRAYEDLEHLEADLIADGINSAERSRLLDETKALTSYIVDLENKRDEIIYELGVREERLTRYLSSRSD